MNINKMLSGSLLLVFDSFARKFIGLISTLILARVLTPDDFGLVAIATIISLFVSSFTQLGSAAYVIRSRRPTRAVLNTAFTLSILIRLLVTVLVIVSIPLTVVFFDESRLTALIVAFCYIILIEGFENPASFLLRRRQEYKPLIKVTIIAKIVSVICAVSIALIYQSYWALVVGLMISSTIQILGSYTVYPYLPRFSIQHLESQWSFSKWLIPQAILGFGRTQFDTFIASTLFGKASLGSYNTMKYLAYIPSQNIITPMTTPLLAQLAHIKNKPEHFQNRFCVSVIISLALSVPIGIFCVFNAESIIWVLMGDNWVKFSAVFACFSVLIITMCLYTAAARLYYIFAQTKPLLIFELTSCIVIGVTLLSIKFQDITEFAVTKIAVELCLILLFFTISVIRYVSLQKCILSLVALFGLLGLSVISVFAGIVLNPFEHKLFEVIFNGLVFVFSYTLGFIALCRLASNTISELSYINDLIDSHFFYKINRFINKEATS